MKPPELGRLAADLLDRFGLALTVRAGKSGDGDYVDFRPSDLHENEGFFVRTTIGWRHVIARLHVGSFAADLLQAMSAADAEQRARFRTLADLIVARGGRTAMKLNDRSVDATRPDSWPHESWKSLTVEVERIPLLIHHDSPEDVLNVLISWGGDLLGMVVALLPTEDLQRETESEASGLPEGAVERVEVNRYERHRLNRTLCIAVHGIACAVCHLNFLERYGNRGRGFIHVHHIVPVSQLGAGYVIDPAKDLVPVCPNCHAMIHRRDPPLSVLELQAEMGQT